MNSLVVVVSGRGETAKSSADVAGTELKLDATPHVLVVDFADVGYHLPASYIAELFEAIGVCLAYLRQRRFPSRSTSQSTSANRDDRQVLLIVLIVERFLFRRCPAHAMSVL